ncbi:MAG: PilN domain-containing protein, partial [Patescibacteria group bacterium]
MISVNLLPEEIRENISYSKKNIKTLAYVRMLIIFAALLISAFGVCFGFLLISNNYYLKSIKETETVIAGYKDNLNEAKTLQEKIKTIDKIKKDYKYWSKINYALSRVTPEGLYITDFVVEEKSKAAAANTQQDQNTKENIKITGVAKDKEVVGIFRDSLESLEGLSQVTVVSIKQEADAKGVIKNKFVINVFVDKKATEKGKVSEK